MAAEFFLPDKVISGSGALQSAVPELVKMGKKALIVTGKTVCKLQGFKALLSGLDESETEYVVFDGITGEPDDKMIEAGAQVYEQSGCDFIISMGGGSPIDSMKAIAVRTASGQNVCDFYGKVIELELPPMAAIPTTAGTGSEATQFTVITDTRRDIKMLLKGPSLMPDLAVIDPTLGVSAPKGITASTGLDALTHAVEAYTSRKAQPLTDDLALSAVKRIFKYLPAAYKNGNDLQAREQMAMAALESGIVINNASVTIVHGMSRPIGALFHVPHGMTNAMLLPKCMSFAAAGAPERFAELGRATGAAAPSESDKEAAEKFIAALGEICDVCEIPTPGRYGINKDDFMTQIDKMADDALASGSPANTIREVKKQDILEIYRSLY